MISAEDRSSAARANQRGGEATGTVPRCVCSWKNCRTYQKGFREAKHPVFDGTIKLKFVKDHPASQALKDSIDRALRVPPERAEDWKPGRRDGQQITRYHVARHHYTEKHIQKYLMDPKGFSFLKPFSVHGAKKYLFTVDNNETFQVGDSSETLYLQTPNVPKEVVKAEFIRLRENYGASQTNAGAATNSNETPNNNDHVKQKAPEKKDSLTVSTTRSQVQLEKEVRTKEMENKKLKDELDMMKSQLTFLHDMVRKLQEEHFDSHTQAGGDHMSVRSGRSYRSQSRSNRQSHQAAQGSSRSMRSGVPADVVVCVGDERSEWDGENTEWEDEQTDTQTNDEEDEGFQVTYSAARRMSGSHSVCGASVVSRGGASIMSASKSIKTLPRELELDEDEDDSDSHDSLEGEAFESRSFASTIHSRSVHSRTGANRGSTHSRSGHNNRIVMQPDYHNGSKPSNAMHDTSNGGGFKKPSRRGSFGDSSNRSARTSATSQSAGTYEVSAMIVTDPYGEKGTYTGSISNSTGMPHGYGRLEYDRAGRWYEGDWKHGRWTGNGQLSNGDGDFYEGGLKNDHKHGHGIMKFADGRTFEGEYINGQMIEGTMTYQDGSTYEGSWVDGMRHGRGKCIFTDDSVYEGEFREGEFSGQGRMTWSDGGMYQGEWWNGEMHGIGKEIRTDGSIRHDGEWCKGQPLRK